MTTYVIVQLIIVAFWICVDLWIIHDIRKTIKTHEDMVKFKGFRWMIVAVCFLGWFISAAFLSLLAYIDGWLIV